LLHHDRAGRKWEARADRRVADAAKKRAFPFRSMHICQKPMAYRVTLGGTTYEFRDLKTLLAKATPLRSGDQLAGLAAG